jgi:hypothetical protein
MEREWHFTLDEAHLVSIAIGPAQTPAMLEPAVAATEVRARLSDHLEIHVPLASAQNTQNFGLRPQSVTVSLTR